MNAINLSDVHKTYHVGNQSVAALRGASVDVAAGTLAVLHGRSGAGKSTLLSLAAGLEFPDSGEIAIGGRRLGGASEEELVRLRRETVSVVYQNFALLPLLTAEENVGVPLRIAKLPAEQRDARVREMLERTGLSGHAKQRPGELSGGQLQRVGIARALAPGPEVLLADEPTGQLDSHTAREVLDLLRGLVDSEGLTALVATHDPVLTQHADEVFELADGTISGEHEPLDASSLA